MKLAFWFLAITVVALTACTSCNNNPPATTNTKTAVKPIAVPSFNADSCYKYVQAQVNFGPRVPNSKAHIKCGDYLIAFFKKYADTVYVQSTTVQAFDGTNLKIRNIIASFRPKAGNRIMICSHWDSRPFADQDKDLKNIHTPIDAADDGASGVAVMMEIARLLKATPPERGIDLICLDAEDSGVPEANKEKYKGNVDAEDSYCLGTQYWCKNLHVPNYSANFGILLDMVGAKDATFTLEGTSMKYASTFMASVWSKAGSLGYGNYFQNVNSGSIIDDHHYINTLTTIPTIDIIYHNMSGDGSWFAPHWHTLKDNMQVIDKATLDAVGNTLTHVISDPNS